MILLVFVTANLPDLLAQRILISDPDKEDSRKINFEIIGKMGNNFLIYKNLRGETYISVYDNNMKQLDRVRHEYLPDERMINVDFFPYTDFVYMIYQYQKRNIVYCMAVKLNEAGKKISEPVELDTTALGGLANNKIYTTLSSEDKQKLIIFKINNRNREKFLITTKLFSSNLELLKKTSLVMPMDDRNDNLGEFSLDNDGNLVFVKFIRTNNENISKAYIIVKKAMHDDFTYYDLNLDKIFLDEVRIKIDNTNNRYLLNAFYYNQKRGSIEGLYSLILNKNTGKYEYQNLLEFSEDLRREAKSEGSLRMAFNDYFIRNIIIKKDGGFLMDAEAFYTTSRSGSWNRWDYMYGSPFISSLDYYYYSPYSYNWLRRGSSSQAVRFHADNMIIFSFDKNGKLEWSNVVRKGQFDDESEDKISYNVVNTGGQLHFLFNLQERRNLLLNDYSLSPDGQINRNPTLKNLDKGHEFMPKFGKQVSATQIIVPCFYRNYICFAKIDFH